MKGKRKRVEKKPQTFAQHPSFPELWSSNPSQRHSRDWPPMRSRQHESLECALSYTHHGKAFEYWIYCCVSTDSKLGRQKSGFRPLLHPGDLGRAGSQKHLERLSLSRCCHSFLWEQDHLHLITVSAQINKTEMTARKKNKKKTEVK